MQDYEIPRVGIGVMILKDQKVLLGKRKNAHGEGEYAFPGGHLDFMESFETCAKRETMEETGMEIEDIRFLFLGNIKKYGNKHYVQVGLIAKWKSGELMLMEPEKSEDWKWYDLDDLPHPMLEFCKMAIEAYKTGKNYFDS